MAKDNEDLIVNIAKVQLVQNNQQEKIEKNMSLALDGLEDLSSLNSSNLDKLDELIQLGEKLLKERPGTLPNDEDISFGEGLITLNDKENKRVESFK